jgi:hypothetical protein
MAKLPTVGLGIFLNEKVRLSERNYFACHQFLWRSRAGREHRASSAAAAARGIMEG